jgi:aminopeptidase
MNISSSSSATKQALMMRNARTIFEINCKPKDSVLIITDSDMDPNVWQSIAAASNDFGCETTVMMMADPREYHGAPPPDPILEASENVKLCISNTSKEYHTGGFQVKATMEKGVGWVVMEQVTADILASPACDPELQRDMIAAAPKLYEKLNKAGTWHITNKSGTDYTVQVREGGGKVETINALAYFVPRRLVAFPPGEFQAGPVPGTGEGIVVWDVSVHHPPGLLREPIRLTIEKGWVKKIEGGSEAEQLKDFIKKYGNENTYKFDIELSIGWNPNCPFTGNLRTDKKRYGKIHTAMGTHRDKSVHIDGVTREISLTIDGAEQFMKDGVINFPPLDTWPEKYGAATP